MILPSSLAVPSPAPRPGLPPLGADPTPRPVPMIERAIQSIHGDWTYQPDIDWGRHPMRAKLDTLEVQLHFAEPTCRNTVYSLVNKATGRPHRADHGVTVEGTDPGHEFVLRLQDPVPTDVVSLARMPSLAGSTVTEVHVALDLNDFRDDDERAQVTAALALVYSAPGIDLSGRGGQRCVYLHRGGGLATDPLAVESMRARPAQTIYFGQRKADPMARIYDKQLDNRVELPFEQRACRHEVVMGAETLGSMGLNSLEDLTRFSFREVTQFFKYEVAVVREPRGVDVVACAKAARNKFLQQTAADEGVARVLTDLGAPMRFRVASGDRTVQRTIGRRRTLAHARLNDRARKAWARFAAHWTQVCSDFGRTRPPKSISHATCAPAPMTSSPLSTSVHHYR